MTWENRNSMLLFEIFIEFWQEISNGSYYVEKLVKCSWTGKIRTKAIGIISKHWNINSQESLWNSEVVTKFVEDSFYAGRSRDIVACYLARILVPRVRPRIIRQIVITKNVMLIWSISKFFGSMFANASTIISIWKVQILKVELQVANHSVLEQI